MRFLDYFRSKRAVSWSQLSPKQKQLATLRLEKAIQASAKYKLVQGPWQSQREAGSIDPRGEDQCLGFTKRAKMLDLARNQLRNSPTFTSILKQFDLQAIGTTGGKAIFNFDDREMSKIIKREFSAWTRNCDFYDGESFNRILKLMLKTYLTQGDCVCVFDNNLVEDSGKILLFESDEIGEVDPEVLQRKYGKFAQQSLGRVYNRNGRFYGAIVSKSQRGKEVFDEDCCYFLKRNNWTNPLESFWIMPRNIFRPNQGRGIPAVASSLASSIDLEEYVDFEIASAKKNAQLFAQVIDSNEDEEIDDTPSAFGDISQMSDEDVDKAIEAESKSYQTTYTLEKAKLAGCIYQVMPPKYKMELLSNNHPNVNAEAFSTWLVSRTAAPLGLSEFFATMGARGDYKANSLITWPAFAEAQKFLESQVCDWAFYQWCSWASAKGIIPYSLDQIDMSKVTWFWPQREENDEVAKENAASLKLKNLTGSYQEILGSDWQEKLDQIKAEIAYCKDNGLPHPAYNMVSGGERSESTKFGDDNQEMTENKTI